jgi:hypothetical protein
MKIIDRILNPGEFIAEIYEKDTLYYHHTAGSHRPDYSIDGWEHDRSKNGGRLPVATAYVIGGISVTDGNSDFDGLIYRAFDDKFCAYHLGLTNNLNVPIMRKSIGIEICNYGPLTKNRDGIFLNYVNKPVPAGLVAELPAPFRGFNFYHKYTDNQIKILGELTLDIVKRHPKINVKQGLQQFLNQGAKAFEINGAALKGVPGLWSHTNVRSDKSDIFPQPQLIELIKSF